MLRNWFCNEPLSLPSPLLAGKEEYYISRSVRQVITHV